jgi:hypothetical protein
MYDFYFQGLAELNVETVPTFKKTVQLLSSGCMSVEEKGSL